MHKAQPRVRDGGVAWGGQEYNGPVGQDGRGCRLRDACTERGQGRGTCCDGGGADKRVGYRERGGGGSKRAGGRSWPERKTNAFSEH